VPALTRHRGVALVLVLAFGALAVPVLRSGTVRDPLTNRFTDHERYRYCSALIVRHPFHALVTPLAQLFAEDTGEHRVVTWGDEPCHEGGVVHVAVHAPIQWLLDAEMLSEVSATHLYVLFLLLIAHLTVWLLWREERWWIGLLLYPFLVRCALNALQEPISFCLAVISALQWQRGQRVTALAFASLAFSSYARWVTWLIPFAWLAFRDRATLLPELREAVRRRPVITALLALCFVWSCFAFACAATSRTSPGAGTGIVGRLAMVIMMAIWVAHWVRHRDTRIAPFAIVSLAFLTSYNGFHMFWYVAPLLAAAPFIASETEAALWAIPAIVGADLFLNREMTAHVADIAHFVVEGFYR